MFSELKKKIIQKKAKIAVIGLGYVGLPIALSFAKKGFGVIGIDSDKDRVERIKNGKSYILDISSKQLRSVLRRNKLQATANFKVLKDADVILICVPTPLKRKYNPNISFILKAVKRIVKFLTKGKLVILESTTYPGTTEEVILPRLESTGLNCGEDFYLAFSPERIDPGNNDYALEQIPKVVGAIDSASLKLGELFYKKVFHKVIPVSSAKTAETVKLLENTFRIVNIGLINEIAMMCHKLNIDIWEVIEAAKTKPFGFMAFYPGPGVGGHCIPKDPLYLYWKARRMGFPLKFIKLASEINSSMPAYIINRLKQILIAKNKALSKSKILILGVTYKNDVKDLRKSPALDIIDLLLKSKTDVSYHDPYMPYLKISNINLKSIDLDRKNLAKFDCVLVVTAHRRLDYNFILNNSKLIFDTRGVFKKQFKNLIKL
ncbi:MAG: nucleotide sugar dehydrogenase [Candidatus Omnitrophota bacterium]|nr:nucleotide sugar dehydrogenase [Candidatus Omnitrophota bacterium]